MADNRNFSLTYLPSEILCEILEKSTRIALLQLTRVSKKLRDLAQWVLEHKKKIRLCGDHLRVLVLSAPSKYDIIELSKPVCTGESKIPRSAIISNIIIHDELTNMILFPRSNHFVCQTTSVNNGGKTRAITLLQTSSEKQFRTKMFMQAFTADLCVLVMDPADIDENAEEIKELVFGSSFMMSARNIIVAIDMHRYEGLSKAQQLGSGDVFNETRAKMSKLLDRTVGPCYKIVPVNAKTGANVAQKLPVVSWFSGPTLKQLILEDQLQTNFDEISFSDLCQKPLLVQIAQRQKISGIGTVLIGRVVRGTLKQGDSVRVHPTSELNAVRSIERRHEFLKEAKPGDYIGFNIAYKSNLGSATYTFEHSYNRYSYVVNAKNEIPVKSTLAFRASLVVMTPDRFTQHQVYTVFYGPSRIRCLLWWVFPKDGKNHDRSERKFKLPIDQSTILRRPLKQHYQSYEVYKVHLNEYNAAVKREKEANILIQGASGSAFKRPPRTKRKKATAILLPLVHYDIETYKPTEFEKNHCGKVMLVEKGSIISVGRVDRVMNVSDNKFKIRDYRKQYNHVVDAGSELFSLPEEKDLHSLFVEHIKNNEHAKASILSVKRMSASW